jgi:hypothetical protein
MSRRSKKPRAPSTADLHAEAYLLQTGEFYPEHHEANVRHLCAKYPEILAGEIKAIYRRAIHIEDEIRQEIGSAQLSQAAKSQLLDWLEGRFYGFPRSVLQEALERVETSHE